MSGHITGIDYFVIAIYFIAVFAIAWWATLRERRHETSKGYFLAGKDVSWFVIGASLFASNIGAEHLVGLAGSGASRGVAVAQFEIMASLILLLLGWVFVPFYIKSGVFTMPEFLERRYSRGARIYLTWISILGYVLTKISVTIAAGGIVFESLMGIHFWTGALIVVVATGVYTLTGGLRAVLYTDLMQMFVLVAGAVAVSIVGLIAVGGWHGLHEAAGSSFLNLWKPASDPDFPWTGILFGVPILGVWYWCTDQFIVQRVLSAKNEDHARRGSIFGGFLKILPLFIFVIPGVIAYVLAQKGQIQLSDPDHALPTLIGTLLPAGIRGLVVAGMIAALMSSLSSVFNSCSTLFTLDVYKKYDPDASEKKLVMVGRIATGILVIFGIIWIPFIKSISGTLYTYIQSVQAYISPPITAVFFLGLFFKRLNGRGAMAALISGFVLGTSRLILEINKDSLSGFFYDYANINFLHFAIILFLVCSVIFIFVSLTAPAPSDEKLSNLTFATTEPHQKSSLWRRRDAQLTIVLLLAVAAVWLYFTG